MVVIKENSMKIDKILWITMAFILSTLLTACSTSPVGPEGEQSPPEAVTKAREALAAFLDVGVESIQIESYERVEWSDSCLGLGGPAESCLAAIHPGWQVMLSVGDNATYEVRTDEMGEIIRIKE